MFVDAMLTFTVGITVLVFVRHYPWTGVEEWPLLGWIRNAWAAFPHVVALAVFFLPIMKIHRALEETRDREIALAAQVVKHEGLGMTAAERRINLDRLARAQALSTWPYNPSAVWIFFSTLLFPGVLALAPNGGRLLRFLLNFGS